jgi:hypothetical protein
MKEKKEVMKLVEDFNRDGYVVLKSFFNKE